MLPAEVQRIILLVGLLATAYLMILAWNEDFGASTQTVVRTDAPTSQVTPGSDLPAVEMAQPQNDAVGDLPDESLFSDAPAQASAATDGKAALVVSVSDDLKDRINAVELVRIGVAELGGKGGGGRPDFAQGGGPDGQAADAAIGAIERDLEGTTNAA